MHIGSVELHEFRNYHTLSWTPSPALNLVSGANAQGKTSLLEALAVVVAGRSFRTSRLAELPRWGCEAAAIAAEARRAGGSRTLRRSIARLEDGSWQGSGDECPWARVVAFAWQDLEIVGGPPVARRNFIDGVAARLAPSHRATFARFRQVLERRNRLLQQRLPAAALAARLEPWDAQLAEAGSELIARRRRAVTALGAELARIHRALTGPGQKIELRYRSSIGEATDPAALRLALERARPAEARRGLTLVGPHRDDLAIEVGSTGRELVDARTFASRGQQRLLALALRLAEVLPITEAVGTPPVLLLDDALSELDRRAAEQVLRESEGAGQVFLTLPDTGPQARGTRWVVVDGGVRAA